VYLEIAETKRTQFPPADGPLVEKPHQGVRDPNATLHQAITFSKPLTASGLPTFVYDSGRRSRCTGKERDAETGLDFFGARYLSAAQGRFTSADEPFADQHAANPQSWNLYLYTLNNPVRYVDPNGRGVGEGLQKAVDDVGIGFLTVVLQPDKVASGLWNAASHPMETLGRVGGAINDFVSASPDQKLTTVTEIAVPLLVGGAMSKLTTAAGEAPTALNLVTTSGPEANTVISGVANSAVVVRGGTAPLPEAGTTFSGAQGATVREAAAGVPHGTIRSTTAAAVRDAGGSVGSAPEATRSGVLNEQHVNVSEGSGRSTFSPPQPNPVPKKERVQ
jgi:RHS repeat-associated protein